MAKTIRLKPKERESLQKRVRSSSSGAELRRAQILLLADKGLSVEKIATALVCGSATVKRVKARYRSEGWLSAITTKKIRGRPGHGVHVAKLVVATACTKPPNDAPKWTVRMLSRATKVSRASVQRILTADGLKPWREKNVVHSNNRPRI